MPVVRLDPNPDTDLRNNDWAPYNNVDEGQFQRDIQHTNSGVYPVVGMLQMGFRLSAEKRVEGRRVAYQMQLQMKPLVGIWNPYNVRISNSSFNFVWALYPYLRLGMIPPGKGQYTHEIWMRESWMSGNTSDRAVENGLDKYFNLTTESIDLEPGEFRLFSVDSRTRMGSNNRLVLHLERGGSLHLSTCTIPRKYGEAEAGDPIIVPAGTVAWYGDLFVEDYQHPSTERHFGDAYSAKAFPPHGSACAVAATCTASPTSGRPRPLSSGTASPTPFPNR